MNDLEKKQLFERRIKEAEERCIEIRKQIDEDGGWVMQGLYHGARRVRADYKDCSYTKGWCLASSEKDLIDAVKTDKIPYNINEVDLRKKYGLFIKNELAPVELSISQYGHISIDRTDEFGEGAKPWKDKTPWYLLVNDDWSFKGSIFFMVFLPMRIMMPISDNLSSKANKAILISTFLGFYLFASFGPKYHFNSSETFLALLLLIYVCVAFIPFWYNGFQKKSL